ncbi:ADP-ribose glycohydrolase MACROD1 isoform X2 [Cheilinus undulatus]|uniref:ADP-ribose glycohydrolase MACROD1 isoform X2 n=1 Tax=Cheilinus undulatus TaxID=241271 RepID=UPI001BD3B25A|nr:ADP-ribose glycohydrolase MACROD1 isoform X2 [Cheilinus undulatus]XP_041653481.1 ADP-ribose glycohydrolase MACROD1 isoform X2 [Cheilinus undulatus]
MRRDCLRSPVKVPKAKLLHGVADIYLFDTDVTRTVVLPDSGMALQMSALFSHIRAPLSTGPLSRIRADFQGAGVKFKHILSPGSPQLGGKPATSPVRGHINAPLRAERFSTTAAVWKSSQGSCPSSPTGRRGWLGKFALGAALGVSTATLVQCLHTGTLTAMAQKVNLNSAEGEWKETKEFLLSLAVKDRRQYYRTSSSVPLEDIPLWTPAAGGTGKPVHQRNEKLDQKISLYSGDITKLEIDAIVNAANKTLLGGGGVDGAIHRAAGPLLKKECASLQGCETGEAKITCGYGLPAKYVIHTVGPIAQGGVGEVERKALRSCYKNSLTTATRNGARSVAFPCISTGIYGYPPEQAVHEALATVREYLDEHHDKLDRVIFCVFLPTDKELYLQNLPLYFPAA